MRGTGGFVPRTSGCRRPDPVVHDRQIERLLPPKTAIPISGPRIGTVYGRIWVESGRKRRYQVTMRLIFIYGPPATGKLTVGRIVAERTGLPLFHNHLVVDAVAAVFPFGSQEFVRLREQFWMDTLSAAAAAGRSIIFTFAPEASVASDFPRRVSDAITRRGGEVVYVALSVDDAEQERRIDSTSRAEFGKLRSMDLLRQLRPSMRECEAKMPTPSLTIDTVCTSPTDAADRIIRHLEDLH